MLIHWQPSDILYCSKQGTSICRMVEGLLVGLLASWVISFRYIFAFDKVLAVAIVFAAAFSRISSTSAIGCCFFVSCAAPKFT